MSGRNTSFYYSFLVLPREKRRAIVAVWDFCRAVDDAVDERLAVNAWPGPIGGDVAAARLELGEWRRELAACYESGTPRRPEASALAPFIRRFGLRRRDFEAVIDGVEMDLDRCRYETFDELREYCLRVASAVGLICLEIFGYRDQRSREFAVELGVALQLTNILRDVAVDLRRGRIYIPLEDLARFSCTEADLAAGEMTENVRALLEHEAQRARGYYSRARQALPRVDRRSLAAARIMCAVYEDVLERIERRGYDVFSGVVRAPRSRRAVIAARTWLTAMAGF
ncbi:MAG: presqualene diphosphate synthase HpnD [Vicinamibacterales bacterium]